MSAPAPAGWPVRRGAAVRSAIATIWIVSLTTVVGALALTLLSRTAPLLEVVQFTIAAVVLVAIGGALTVRAPRNRVGLVLLGAGVGLCVWLLSGAYAVYALGTRGGALPGGRLAAWVQAWTPFPSLMALTILVPLWFPSGQVPSPRWRALERLALAALALVTVAFATRPGPLGAISGVPPTDNPFGVDLGGAHAAVDAVGHTAVTILIVLASASVWARYRRAGEVERSALRYLGFAVVASAVFALTSVIVGANASGPVRVVAGLVGVVGFAGIPVAAAQAILRYRLYETQLLVSRAATSLFAAVVLTGGYLAVAALVQEAADGSRAVGSIAGAAAVVGLALPLRNWIGGRVERLLYGDRARPERAVPASSTASRWRPRPSP